MTEYQKEMAKVSLGLFGRTLLAGFLSLLLYVSVSFIFSSLTTETIGYDVYELQDGSYVLVDEVRYADQSEISETPAQTTGTTAPPEIPPAGEESVTTPATTTAQQMKQSVRSDPPAWAVTTADVISQVCMLLLFLGLVYSATWHMGDRDRNRVGFGRMERDNLRGLKAGLLASVPAGLAYLGLFVCKLTGLWPAYAQTYRYLNIVFLPIYNAIVPVTIKTMAELGWGQIALLVLPLCVLPLFAYIGYRLGYKQLSVAEKLIYKTTGKKPKRNRDRLR